MQPLREVGPLDIALGLKAVTTFDPESADEIFQESKDLIEMVQFCFFRGLVFLELGYSL